VSRDRVVAVPLSGASRHYSEDGHRPNVAERAYGGHRLGLRGVLDIFGGMFFALLMGFIQALIENRNAEIAANWYLN
jgi:hypothetical protein